MIALQIEPRKIGDEATERSGHYADQLIVGKYQRFALGQVSNPFRYVTDQRSAFESEWSEVAQVLDFVGNASTQLMTVEHKDF